MFYFRWKQGEVFYFNTVFPVAFLAYEIRMVVHINTKPVLRLHEASWIHFAAADTCSLSKSRVVNAFLVSV